MDPKQQFKLLQRIQKPFVNPLKLKITRLDLNIKEEIFI